MQLQTFYLILWSNRVNWYKKAGRPRYRGQLQGDENRPGQSFMEERFQENELVEGPLVANLRAYFKAGNWDEFNRYVDQLRAEGHAEQRIQSMISSATLGKI